MPTFWTRTLIPTLRQVPAEAEVPSHQLMLRAGFIRKLGAGVYDYLPLGWRSLSKAAAIVREEMAHAGAIEVFLPTLIPLEMFKQTGRDAAYGDNLFRFKDRHGREQALGPTHEEVITEMVGACVDSYKQLPVTLYQIQTKFRDEFRPRFGVLRSREFQMKDAYSFHLNVDGPGGLNEVYQAQYDAYCRIFSRCGLPYLTVEAESGPIGGSASHEFMVPSPTGEDTLLESDKGNYAANVEKCDTGPRRVSEVFRPIIEGHGQPSVGISEYVPAQEPKGALEKVHTPNTPGIEDVIEFFKKNLGTKLKAQNMLKTLVYEPVEEAQRQAAAFVVAVVRGDHEVNEGKLKAACGFAVQLADLARAKAAGFAVGFVGPHAPVACRIYVDPDAAIDQFWVTGANEPDHHVKCFHWKRDLLDGMEKGRLQVADLRNAVDGDPSPKGDGGVLRVRKGIEIGHVFKLGDKYSRAMGITVLNQANERQHPIMGCYGIGVNRLLAAAIERQSPKAGCDENGILWPASIAPYQVVITALKFEGAQKETALKLAAELEQAPSPNHPRAFFHVDVLIDDRDERPGVKFKDADLIGIPVRLVIGDKALAEGKVEIKARDGSNGPKGELVPLEQAAARTLELLKAL